MNFFFILTLTLLFFAAQSCDIGAYVDHEPTPEKRAEYKGCDLKACQDGVPCHGSEAGEKSESPRRNLSVTARRNLAEAECETVEDCPEECGGEGIVCQCDGYNPEEKQMGACVPSQQARRNLGEAECSPEEPCPEECGGEGIVCQCDGYQPASRDGTVPEQMGACVPSQQAVGENGDDCTDPNGCRRNLDAPIAARRKLEKGGQLGEPEGSQADPCEYADGTPRLGDDGLPVCESSRRMRRRL